MIVPVQTFPALEALDRVRHAFTLRQPGLNVSADRDTALQRLDESHTKARVERMGGRARLVTARQVHGCEVVIVDERSPSGVADVADGLITNASDICLGIYVADCCAIFLVDPIRRAIGLLHSGKKGTELGIAANAINAMRHAFGSEPCDLVVQLSPCIRPPLYEIDFAAQIIAQCRASGVEKIFDCAENTGADLERFYSYRIEMGRTGRMLALLALVP